jgi:hypothetical protein
MRSGRSGWLAALAAFLVLACTGPSPTRVPPPIPTPEETDTPRPIFSATPSVSPTQAASPSLHVGGLATVLFDGISQVVDPAHPNHDRDLNSQLGILGAGEQLYLVDQVRQRRETYWQVARLPDTLGQSLIGWIPEVDGARSNIEPFQPTCPTTFPLSAADLTSNGALTALSCFGQTELTLSGTVTCERGTADGVIGGAGFLDSNRFCALDDQLGLLGGSVTSLLDTHTTPDSVMGRFLVRGHLDDPQAQNCTTIPFGTSLNTAAGPPEPGPVLSCRQMFVVSTVTPLD